MRLSQAFSSHTTQMREVPLIYSASSVRAVGSASNGNNAAGFGLDLLMQFAPSIPLMDMAAISIESKKAAGKELHELAANGLTAGFKLQKVHKAVPVCDAQDRCSC